MNKVLIKSSCYENKYGDLKEEVAVYLNDEWIGGGSYGGEPEDNMRGRDYNWVEPLLMKLASMTGCETKFEFTENPLVDEIDSEDFKYLDESDEVEEHY